MYMSFCLANKFSLPLCLCRSAYLEPGTSRATRGPGKPLLRGLSQPHSLCVEIETSNEGKGGNVGRMSSHHPTIGVWESTVSSPSEVRAEPWPKINFVHIWGQERSHLEHPFQYLWATAGPPNVAGPEKTPPSRRFCLERSDRSCQSNGRWSDLAGLASERRQVRSSDPAALLWLVSTDALSTANTST